MYPEGYISTIYLTDTDASAQLTESNLNQVIGIRRRRVGKIKQNGKPKPKQGTSRKRTKMKIYYRRSEEESYVLVY